MKISIKLLVFSDRLFVSRHGEGWGGGGRGYTGLLMGREGVSNSGVGATTWWRGVHRGADGEGGGGQQWGGGNKVVAGGGGQLLGGGVNNGGVFNL